MERGYAAEQGRDETGFPVILTEKMGCGQVEKEYENSVYVQMMADSLKKKEHILEFLYKKTAEQETILRSEDPDLEQFQQTIDEKGSQITQLGQLDDGFDTLFRLVEKEIQQNRSNYKEEIMEMQDRIRRVSELGMKIQVLERQNGERLKGFLAKKKSEIRGTRMGGRTASSYYQNMANAHKSDQSYYLNEIK